MIGVDPLRPGIGSFHAMFSVVDHFTGSPVSELMPFIPGPRQAGQFSADSVTRAKPLRKHSPQPGASPRSSSFSLRMLSQDARTAGHAYKAGYSDRKASSKPPRSAAIVAPSALHQPSRHDSDQQQPEPGAPGLIRRGQSRRVRSRRTRRRHPPRARRPAGAQPQPSSSPSRDAPLYPTARSSAISRRRSSTFRNITVARPTVPSSSPSAPSA